MISDIHGGGLSHYHIAPSFHVLVNTTEVSEFHKCEQEMRGKGCKSCAWEKVKSLVRSFENLSSFKSNEITVSKVRYV